MNDYCTVCGIYEDVLQFRTLACGCRFCKTSVSGWVIAQLDNFYKENFELTCPQCIFGHILSEEDIKVCLSKVQFASYEAAVLKRRLLQDSSFKQCPMNQCNYIGWVDYKQKCRQSLICEKCKSS